MSDLMKIIEAGKALSLEGTKLREFVERREQEERERDERAAARELEKLRLEVEREKAKANGEKDKENQCYLTPRLPKLPLYNEKTDEIDSWIHRFEVHARNVKWPERDWAACLSNLLTGQALNVLHSISAEDNQDYGKIKNALLKRFQCTEDGFRERFRKAHPEREEDFDSFINRMTKYLDRWIDLAGIENGDFQALHDLVVKDQLYQSCNPDLVAFLKERNPKNIREIKQLAEQYATAHPSKLIAKENTPNDLFIAQAVRMEDRQSRSKDRNPDFRRTQNVRAASQQRNRDSHDRNRDRSGWRATQRTNESKCEICFKSNHRTDQCFKQKKPAMENKVECQICHKNHTADKCFRYTKLAKKQQSYHVHERKREEIVTHANTTTVMKETGELKFHTGTLNGKICSVLRDTGNNSIGVKESLIRPEDITDKEVECIVYGGDVKRFKVAVVDISTPFFKGRIQAHVLPQSIADVIIGNIKGVIDIDNVDMRNYANPATTRSMKVVNERPTEEKEISQDQQSIQDNSERMNVIFNHFEMSKAQADDESIQELIQGKSAKEYITENGIVYRIFKENNNECRQLVVPKKYREKVMEMSHDSIHAGHLGVTATRKRIMPHFTWKGITRDIKEYVKTCDACQRNTPKGRNPRIPLDNMEVISNPFEKVAIDIIGPLKPSKSQNRYILTLVDYATRWPEAIPLRRITTEDVSNALTTIFYRLGTPKEMLSDNAQQLSSKLMAEVMTLMNIKQRHSTPYHAQSNGLVERMNGTLKSMIKKLSEDEQDNWDKHLPALLYAYREIPNSSTGYSPFELMFGRQPRGPLAIIKELCSKDGQEDEKFHFVYDYVKELKDKITKTCVMAQNNATMKSIQYKDYADKKAKEKKFKTEDLVLALLPVDNNSSIMSFQGPYKVTAVRSGTNYELDIGGKRRTYHANLLKKYNKREANQTNSVFQMACTSMITDEQEKVHENEPMIMFNETQQTENYKDVKISKDLSDQQRREAKSALREFENVLTDIPGKTSCIEHEIRLTSDIPIKSKPYPTPLHAKDEVRRELQSMLDMGIVRPSTSPYSSPIVVVKKKCGKLRVCIDFRKINGITVFDAEPIPNQDEMMTRLSKAKYFTKIDLSKGYWQIPLKEECKRFTAFQSELGLLEYNYLPFGLNTAASTFQRMMRMLLKNTKNAISYFDDVLIFGETWNEHISTLKEVLQKFAKEGLTAKPTKTVIGFQEVEFLGHIVGKGVQKPEASKVEKIKTLRPPTTKKDVRKVLGLLNYYRKFVPNFSTIALPLTELTKKNMPNKIKWTTECDNSFEKIKEMLSSTPVLSLPDLSQQFTLRTDASDYGVGGVLMQEVEGEMKPCAYISRKLLDRERKYAIIEKECLAIVFCISAFQKFLLLKEFIVETDHKPLTFMNTNKTKNSRLMRWALSLQIFKFRIKPIPGQDNLHADILSRLTKQ